MTTALTDAIATLEQTEQQLVAQLEATRRAIGALRDVAGGPASTAEAAPAVTLERTVAVLKTGTLGQPAAEARERAVLAAITAGTYTIAGLRVAVRTERGITERQHNSAVSNALSRLRMDGLIERHAHGWELTAKGRKAAGGQPAKEPP